MEVTLKPDSQTVLLTMDNPWVQFELTTRDDVPYTHNMVYGLIFPPFISQKRVDDLKSLQLHPDDVFIVTYAKSGTTWAQQITNLIRNQGKDDPNFIMYAVPWIESERPAIPIEDLDKMPSPRFFKTHNPYDMMAGGLPHTSQAKYIYIARNPKDVAVSYYYHMRMLTYFNYSGTWDEFYQLYTSGKMMFGDWYDHVLEWWKHRDAKNILFLKYEDMKKDHRGAVKKIAEFMGYNLREELIDTIVEKSTLQSMRDNPAANPNKVERPVPIFKQGEEQFLRKGIVGDWRNHFTPEQNAEFDAIYAEKMKGSGLDFDF